MKIVQKARANGDRQKAWRQQQGDSFNRQEAARKRTSRLNHIPRFVGVDSEGIGRGKNHRAVLLGCGSAQYIANDKRVGLQWKEVFEFLYHENFERNPEDTVYVGFYLSYDFNEWLKTLPEKASRSLLTNAGKAKRAVPAEKARYSSQKFYPVRCDGWEIDMLGMKSLSIRPRVCTCLEDQVKCEHDQLPWMHICDAGPFFQTSFLNVLKEWPDIRTDAEYKLVERGKNSRANGRLNAAMLKYNALENELLARVMVKVAEGFRDIGIKLRRSQWYGPGVVAQVWLSKNDGVKNSELQEIDGMSEWLNICRKSYFGGWFEIFSHGIIKGKSHNYDINSAYPYAATKLPHICDACDVSHSNGAYKGNGMHVLLRATVFSKGKRIGAVPHRNKQGSILRPNVSTGWYWKFELDAAQSAGLVKQVKVHEHVVFVPCTHPNPFSRVADLYDERNRVGKNTPQGKAIKLIINSIYGKFAQSTGGAPYNNWFYASYITAHCRTKILNAIATHPRKADAVLMVATDGICFDSPHPTLPISKQLGHWEGTDYQDLCLFKPGVYWHKDGKDALLEVKSRGVPKAQFVKGIDIIERIFQECMRLRQPPMTGRIWLWVLENLVYEMRDDNPDAAHPSYFLGYERWPQFEVSLSFHMISCKQALARGKWHLAGLVEENIPMMQSSDPSLKRGDIRFNKLLNRIDSEMPKLELENAETKYYKDPTIEYPLSTSIGYGLKEDPRDAILESVSTARDKRPNYDINIEEYEWRTVWDGGPVI